jgi:hypothetical protein
MSRSALLTAAAVAAVLSLSACAKEARDPAPDTTADAGTPGAPATAPAPAAPAGNDDEMHRGHRLEIQDIYVIAGTESGEHVQPEGCRDGCKAHATCISWKWTESIISPDRPGSCTWWATVGTPVPSGSDRDVAGVIASKAG